MRHEQVIHQNVQHERGTVEGELGPRPATDMRELRPEVPHHPGLALDATVPRPDHVLRRVHAEVETRQRAAGVPMTNRDRHMLKTLIDQRRRELVADDEDVCVGCGADYDSCTYGCRTCVDRKRNRKQPERRGCSECGCRYEERTTGCHACTERHRYRRKRAKVVA